METKKMEPRWKWETLEKHNFTQKFAQLSDKIQLAAVLWKNETLIIDNNGSTKYKKNYFLYVVVHKTGARSRLNSKNDFTRLETKGKPHKTQK